MQWAIGLELLLLVEDPWRVFLTTDHPNGGPFTSYPHLIRLLMERTFREQHLDRIDPEAAAASCLRGLSREYTLNEIAIMTRAGPAKILGLRNMGRLSPGAVADIVAYRPNNDHEAMFSRPAWVFRRGVAFVRDGHLIATPPGFVHRVSPKFDQAFSDKMECYLRDTLGVGVGSYAMSSTEFESLYQGRVETQPCSQASTNK